MGKKRIKHMTEFKIKLVLEFLQNKNPLTEASSKRHVKNVGGGVFWSFSWVVLVVGVGVPVHTVLAKTPCEKVAFDRHSWGFNSTPHRARILTGKAQSKSGNVGKTFRDEYTGKVLALNTVDKSGKKLSNAHVDHVVPLKYMHDNGGCKWSLEKKKRFANNPKNLKLISAYANTSKGSKNPSQWLPDTKRAQIKYLKYWNEVMNEYGASKLKMKAFKFGDPKFVKYAKVAGKFGKVGVRFIPVIGTVATLVTAADTVIIISEDPDKYFEELATDFNKTKETSFEWSSASWDNTKKWSLESWEDTSNWAVERNAESFKWTTQIWDTAKNGVEQLTDDSLGVYNDGVVQLNRYTEEHINRDNWGAVTNAVYSDGVEKLNSYKKKYINQENWEVIKHTTNGVVDRLIEDSSNLYKKGVEKLDKYIGKRF